MKRFPIFLVLLLAGASSISGVALAQLDLQGAAPSAAAKPEREHEKEHKAKSARSAATPRIAIHPPELDSVIDKDLMRNGGEGALRLSGDAKEKTLRIEKLTLPGEVISDPKQKCRIDIVAQTPIEATLQGNEEGVPRYSADIPACPLSFDVLDGAVEVPQQTNTCVFQAADCQASPSGVWGPDGNSMDRLAKVFTRERSLADASIASSIKYLERRDKTVATSLTQEETDFAARRDDVCHDYVGESRHGFCETRVTQARAALLTKRTENLKPEEKAKRKKHARDADN